MKIKRFIVIAAAALFLLSLAIFTISNPALAQEQNSSNRYVDPPCQSSVFLTACSQAQNIQAILTNGPNLVQTVRQATEEYKDIAKAEEDGYGMFLGCVSGRSGGAMGVHYPNGIGLIGDGALDAMTPEVLIYEFKNGKQTLVGVEYLVLYDEWHANNGPTPPVLMGQVFNYSGSPNRYGMPAFYELHVWAWKANPNGVFADWNPNVSCEDFK
jgi:hypothetical protein